MSVKGRLDDMEQDGTELNLDGINKPNLAQISEKAECLTGMHFLFIWIDLFCN